MSDVFAALGDPTRRSILERLRTRGPLSLTTLSEGLPMTRQAVTKHLKVLETAGLVRGSFSGRERIHVLTDAPLQELSDWLAPYEAAWDERLARLHHYLEAEGDGDGDDDG